MLMVGAIIGFYLLGGGQYLELEYVRENLQKLRSMLNESPVIFTSAFVGIILFLTTLSIPGSIVLTLLAGAVLGVGKGLFWVMFATTVGACLSFLISRYMFRSYFQNKFRNQFHKMNHRIKKEGISYLFTLRMIPVSPYVVINVVMGLSEMRLWNFAWVTCLGMLPGTFLYVLAGKKLSTINKISEILSWEILLGLTVLGLLPPLIKLVMKNQSGRLAHE
ncbi:MAG: TVP38/TMEM64 family protein [Bdellovibrionota bacterium]